MQNKVRGTLRLSRYEQETIIGYNQAEQTASVYTHDPKLLKKLARLKENIRSRYGRNGRIPTPCQKPVS